MSLCYSCSSAYASFKGTLRVGCGLHRDNRDAAESEIKKQFEVLARGEFSNEELAAAKKSLSHYLRQLSDSPSALESFYYSRIVAKNPDTVERLARSIEAVTREDVVREANAFSLHTVYFLEGMLNEEETDDDEN
jgi:predicted Zn-dependent peptidase